MLATLLTYNFVKEKSQDEKTLFIFTSVWMACPTYNTTLVLQSFVALLLSWVAFKFYLTMATFDSQTHALFLFPLWKQYGCIINCKSYVLLWLIALMYICNTLSALYLHLTLGILIYYYSHLLSAAISSSNLSIHHMKCHALP
jgi:hypothetical protein